VGALAIARDAPHTPLADATGGIPEPAAWSMMIVGFGAVGAILRRRRGSALPA